jgi:hypothetical protein
MHTGIQLLVAYLVIMTALIIVSIVVWSGSGELKKFFMECRGIGGFAVFIMVAYLLPVIVCVGGFAPKLIDKLRVLIFKPTQFTVLKGQRTDA